MRQGFTLLEMLLATAISALLMAALYMAMDIQMRHAQAGRDIIEQSTLARALLSRLTRDITECVTPAAPRPSIPLPKDNNPSGDGSASRSSSPSGPSAAPQSETTEFNLGVQGGPSELTLYVSRLPRELNSARTEVLSDLRLVTYWLAHDGGRPLGLARREAKRVTSDDAGALPAAARGPEQAAFVVAGEVQSLQFRYFDGTQWQETWDGSATGPDFLTPIGPPVLIEIVLGIATPSGDSRSGGRSNLKYYPHSVAIPTADGVAR